MSTVSTDGITDAVAHALAQKVGRTIGMRLGAQQRTALLLIASTLQDTATISDLVAGSSIENATRLGIASDTIGRFAPVRLALQALSTTRGQLLLFYAFVSDRQVLARKLDGAPTHIEVTCRQCGDRIRSPAKSWRDIKRRPRQCSRGHVFAFGSAAFIRLTKSQSAPS